MRLCASVCTASTTQLAHNNNNNDNNDNKTPASEIRSELLAQQAARDPLTAHSVRLLRMLVLRNTSEANAVVAEFSSANRGSST